MTATNEPRQPIALYAVGLCYASACTSQSDEDTVRYADAVASTGLDHGWSVSPEPTFRSGLPNPCPCDKNPETHRHILLEC